MLAGLLLAGALTATPPPPPPKLFAALSAQYLGTEQFGAGIGYRFNNNITVVGQVLAGTFNPDNLTVEVCRGGHSRNRCKDIPVVTPSERNTGFAITVLIPIK